MNIPKELKGQPWSDILWNDVQQYAQLIDTHLSISDAPTVIDVGGNIGAAALLFHLRYQARVLSIEAIGQTYTQLQKNCSSYEDINTIHQAIGDTEKIICLYRYPLAPGLGGLDSSPIHIWYILSMQVVHKISWGSFKDVVMTPLRIIGAILWSIFALVIVVTRKKQQVKQQTLSYVIDDQFGKINIDLIKIDIEGHELKALRGLRTEHWKRIQSFIIEVHPQHVDDVLTLLHQNGCTTVHREPALLHGDKIPEIIIAKRIV